jgi:hypothetical protein
MEMDEDEERDDGGVGVDDGEPLDGLSETQDVSTSQHATCRDTSTSSPATITIKISLKPKATAKATPASTAPSAAPAATNGHVVGSGDGGGSPVGASPLHSAATSGSSARASEARGLHEGVMPSLPVALAAPTGRRRRRRSFDDGDDDDDNDNDNDDDDHDENKNGDGDHRDERSAAMASVSSSLVAGGATAMAVDRSPSPNLLEEDGHDMAREAPPDVGASMEVDEAHGDLLASAPSFRSAPPTLRRDNAMPSWTPSVKSKETACREQIKIVRAQLKLQPNDPVLCETLAQLMQDLEHFQERVDQVMRAAPEGLFYTHRNALTQCPTFACMTM